LNDLCDGEWLYQGNPKFVARVETMVEVALRLGPVVVVVAGSGEYWNIAARQQFDADRDRAIQMLRGVGICALDGMPFLESVRVAEKA
jgi:hypothetical protein